MLKRHVSLYAGAIIFPIAAQLPRPAGASHDGVVQTPAFLGIPPTPPPVHATRRYISLDDTFALSFGPSVKSQDLKDAQLDLASRMLTGVSTNYVEQTTTFREIVISEENLPGFTDMLTNGTIQFTLSRCDKAFAGYSSIRVSEVGRARGCLATAH